MVLFVLLQKKTACLHNKCKDKRISFNQVLLNDDITWNEWSTITEKRIIRTGKKEEEKVVTITLKKSKSGLVSDLLELFEQQIKRYKKHLFLIRAQYGYFKERRDTLEDNQCIVHVDFSENYVCKLGTEIQSMHFGASKRQITLHTGVYYAGKNPKPKTFCTVSESLNHGPAAIWAHLHPILTEIKKTNPNINSLSCFSDGPTTQYRQKGNFYLASTLPFKFGFNNIEWNFFESGHGKGIPDAIGGALKRNADRHIKYGNDVTSAKAFVDLMVNSSTQCFLIEESSINDMQCFLQKQQLKTVVGTMKLHQLLVQSKNEILYRDVSCACVLSEECSGHMLKVSKLVHDQPVKDTKIVHNTCSRNKTDNSSRKDTPLQNVEIKQPQTVRKEEVDTSRHDKILKELKSCRSYTQLKKKCVQLNTELNDLVISSQRINFMNYGLEVDTDSMDLYPDDVPDERALYPCKVPADGNCLPSSGSVLACGSSMKATELRIRILMELTLNDSTYLDNNFLQRGFPLQVRQSASLPKLYAQYSDMFTVGMPLDEKNIRNIYQIEIMKIRRDKTYMGIWQIHALSSVLKSPIYSIYPKLGNPNVRGDINRLVLPRCSPDERKDPLYIMWTSTRTDMVQEHWIPNHFVPVLTIDNNETETIEIDVENGKQDMMGTVETEKEDIESKGEEKEATDENGKADRMEEIENAGEEKMEEKENAGEEKMEEIENAGEEKMEEIENASEEKMEEIENAGEEKMEKIENAGEEKMEEKENSRAERLENKENAVVEKMEEIKNGEEKDEIETERADKLEENESERTKKIEEIEHRGAEKINRIENGAEDRQEESKGVREIADSMNKGAEKIEEAESGEKEMMEDNESIKEQNWKMVPTATECIGKYVIVNYEGTSYPGYVEEAGESDVFVECMHRVGKKHKNCFFWPRKIKDKCWYDHDDILAIIPQPQTISGSFSHLEVDKEIWESLTEHT